STARPRPASTTASSMPNGSAPPKRAANRKQSSVMTSPNGLRITRIDDLHLDVQIDRAQRSNSLDTPTVQALTDVVLEAYEDETRLLTLSGAGKNFCSGFDTGQGGFSNKKERNNR